MTPSESQSEKDSAPSVPTSSAPALPAVIKDKTDATEYQVLAILDSDDVIDATEKYLLVPHPRVAYLETAIVYLRNPTGTPPASQCGMQEIGELLKRENAETLLKRYEKLLSDVKMFPAYLRGAIDYLRQPTNAIADINKHAINIGKVWIHTPIHLAVQILHAYFRQLQYQFHRSAFEAAVSPEKPQDIMKFFTSYPPLSQLRSQFARDGHAETAQEIEGMLDHEMRLKNGVDLSASTNETQDTTQLIADAETFLATGTLTNPADITMFERILGFLRSPTDEFSDIQQRCNDIGGILADFWENTPAALDAINIHFMGLVFGHHFKELKAAVAENPQNIQRVSKAMSQAVEAAKYSGASVQQELNAFLQAHEIRKKQ